MTPQFSQLALALHNKYRKKHKSEQLIWDKELEREARSHAAYLLWTQKNTLEPNKSVPFGQNIFQLKQNEPQLNPVTDYEAAEYAINTWYHQKEYHTLGSSKGHSFTQLICPETRKVGVGIERKQTANSLDIVVVAFYDPPANEVNVENSQAKSSVSLHDSQPVPIIIEKQDRNGKDESKAQHRTRWNINNKNDEDKERINSAPPTPLIKNENKNLKEKDSKENFNMIVHIDDPIVDLSSTKVLGSCSNQGKDNLHIDMTCIDGVGNSRKANSDSSSQRSNCIDNQTNSTILEGRERQMVTIESTDSSEKGGRKKSKPKIFNIFGKSKQKDKAKEESIDTKESIRVIQESPFEMSIQIDPIVINSLKKNKNKTQTIETVQTTEDKSNAKNIYSTTGKNIGTPVALNRSVDLKNKSTVTNTTINKSPTTIAKIQHVPIKKDDDRSQNSFTNGDNWNNRNTKNDSISYLSGGRRIIATEENEVSKLSKTVQVKEKRTMESKGCMEKNSMASRLFYGKRSESSECHESNVSTVGSKSESKLEVQEKKLWSKSSEKTSKEYMSNETYGSHEGQFLKYMSQNSESTNCKKMYIS